MLVQYDHPSSFDLVDWILTFQLILLIRVVIVSHLHECSINWLFWLLSFDVHASFP